MLPRHCCARRQLRQHHAADATLRFHHQLRFRVGGGGSKAEGAERAGRRSFRAGGSSFRAGGGGFVRSPHHLIVDNA